MVEKSNDTSVSRTQDETKRCYIWIVLCLAITVLVFWPILTNISGSLSGFRSFSGFHRSDIVVSLTLPGWINEAFSNGRLPFFCTVFSFPFGVNLGSIDGWLHPVLLAPFRISGNYITIYNCSLFLSFSFSFWACWLLGKQLSGKNRWGAFVFAGVSCLNSFVGNTIYFDNNGYHLLFGFIPLTVLVVLKGLDTETPGRRRLMAAAAGICWFLSFLTTSYYGMMLLMAGIFLLAYCLIARVVPARKLLVFAAESAVLPVVLVVLFIGIIYISPQGDTLLSTGTKARKDVRTIVDGFLTNNTYQFFKDRFFHSIKEHRQAEKMTHSSRHEVIPTSLDTLFNPLAERKSKSVYVGFGLALLLLFALFKGDLLSLPAWLMGAGFFLLAMGPLVGPSGPLSYAPWSLAARFIPGFRMFSIPPKFFLPAFMCFGVSAARCVARCAGRRSRTLFAVAVLLSLLAIADMIGFNFVYKWNVTPVTVPECYNSLAGTGGDGVLLEIYPFSQEIFIKDILILYQNFHGMTMVESLAIPGLKHRVPRRLMMGLMVERLADAVPSLESIPKMTSDEFSNIIRSFGFTHIMLHRDLFPAYYRYKIQEVLEEDFGQPIASSDGLALFVTGVPEGDKIIRTVAPDKLWAMIESSASFKELASQLLTQ